MSCHFFVTNAPLDTFELQENRRACEGNVLCRRQKEFKQQLTSVKDIRKHSKQIKAIGKGIEV